MSCWRWALRERSAALGVTRGSDVWLLAFAKSGYLGIFARGTSCG